MALSRRSHSTRLLVFSLVMLSLLTITVDFRGGQRGPFETFGSRVELTVIGPLQQGVSRVLHPISSFFVGLAHVGSLEARNKALEGEVQRLRTQLNVGLSTKREVERLQALLKLEQGLELKGVVGRVIGEGISNFEWSVTIDRGSSNGIKVDMPVVTGEGLVGHVVTVSSHWSSVMLIIDPRSAVAARLVTSGETGLILGQERRPLSMDLVNPNSTVPPQEQVVTSGYQGGLYPPEIPIGFVSSTYTRPGNLTKSLLIRPAVDFSSLEFVEVVTGRTRKARR